MKTFSLFLFTIILLTLGFSCCTNNSTFNDIMSEYPLSFKPKTSDSILLVDRFAQKIVSYNTKKYHVDNKMDAENYMIYDFNPEYKYYTAGHSINLGFKIIVINNSVSIIQNMKSNEGIFPLAISEKYFFFIKSTYDSDSMEINRNIVIYNKEKNILIEYLNISGLISYGALIDSTLYFTVYIEEKNNYSLYSVSCEDPNDIPILLQIDLQGGEIFAQGNILYLTDHTNILSEKDSYVKEPINYFIKDKYLLQYRIQKNGDMNAVLINTEMGKTVYVANNIIDILVENDSIIFYCDGAIEMYNMVNERFNCE